MRATATASTPSLGAWNITAALMAAGVALALLASNAKAQSAAPKLRPPTSDQTAPTLPPSGEDLSKRLDRSNGVIHPPPTGDAEIHVPAKDPNAGTMPIIRPPEPGTSNVHPK